MWDRLPTETPKSYAAFLAYVALGARRSVREAARQAHQDNIKTASSSPDADIESMKEIRAEELTLGGGTPEFEVTAAFVAAIWPTDLLREAAYTSGRLRAQPSESGTVRTCTLP